MNALDDSMSESLPPFLATDPDAYEHFMGRWSVRLAETFLDFAGVRSGCRVLDVGCGTGTMSLALAKRGAKTIGLDMSEPYLSPTWSGGSAPSASTSSSSPGQGRGRKPLASSRV
jgi:SAM-dependent methyltransferase